MIRALLRRVDQFIGRGDWAVTVPVMDGPLKPNDRLEKARNLATLEAPDNLVRHNSKLWLSSGAELLEGEVSASGVALRAVAKFAAPISCLAVSRGGALAVGVEGIGIQFLGGEHSGAAVPGNQARSATAALFLDEHTLVVANGAAVSAQSDWRRDLMSLGRSGSIVRYDLSSGASSILAEGLGYANGLAVMGTDRLAISESWRHRVVSMPINGGNASPLLEHLPCYPGRIVPSSAEGYWITMFAVRNQLVEFVLRERGYCDQMLAEVEPDYWVAPTLSSGHSYEEPLQGGAVKQMGILKPWSPTRSYGLLVRCDREMRIIESFHSRADGRMHGVTAAVETAHGVLVASKGGNALLRLEP